MNRIKQIIPYLDQAVVSGGNFLLGVFLARVLGLEHYGEYALAWLVVLFCSSIHHAWIINPMYTFYPKYDADKKSEYLKSLFVHQLIYSCVASFVSYVVFCLSNIYFLEWKMGRFINILPILIFIYLMYDFFRRVSYVQKKRTKALFMNLLIYLVQFIAFTYVYIQNKVYLYDVYLILSLSFLISFGFGVRFFLDFRINKSFFVQSTFEHWQYSRWLIGTALLQWVSGNYFILAAGGILGPIIVGAIRILQNIVGVLHVLFLALENLLPIKLSEIYQKKGISNMLSFSLKFALKAGGVTIFLVVLISFFGKSILGFLYDNNYLEYHYLLYYFSILYVLVFIGTCLRFIIRTIEKTATIFIAYIFSTMMSLISANQIVQTYQIKGVLYGLILSQIIMILCFCYSIYIEFRSYKQMNLDLNKQVDILN